MNRDMPRCAFFELPDETRADKPSHRFLELPSMRMGIYKLAAGAEDPQKPHEHDEVYYVVEGRAMLQVDDDFHPVKPGTLAFVSAAVPHKFVDIAEDLSILVFFSHYKPGV